MDGHHVRRLALQVDPGVRPVAYRVHPPTSQAPLGDSGVRLFPTRPVLAEQVRPGEVERPVALALVVSVRPPVAPAVELRGGGPGLGQGLEIVHPIGNRRGGAPTVDAVGAVGPEEPSLGVHQPPFIFVFRRMKKVGGRQLGPAGPAAVGVPAVRSGVGGQVGSLGLAMLGQLRPRVRLAGPVFVDVLPELVNEREERLGRHRSGGPAGANGVYREGVIGLRGVDEDHHLRDVGRVERAGPAGGHAAHADDFRRRDELHGARVQGNRNRPFRPDAQRRRAADAVLHAVGPRVVHATKHANRRGAHVGHVDRHIPPARQVPPAPRRHQRNTGPFPLMPRLQPQRLALPRRHLRDLHVVGLQRRDVQGPVEVQQNLVAADRGARRHRRRYTHPHHRRPQVHYVAPQLSF